MPEPRRFIPNIPPPGHRPGQDLAPQNIPVPQPQVPQAPAPQPQAPQNAPNLQIVAVAESCIEIELILDCCAKLEESSPDQLQALVDRLYRNNKICAQGTGVAPFMLEANGLALNVDMIIEAERDARLNSINNLFDPTGPTRSLPVCTKLKGGKDEAESKIIFPASAVPIPILPDEIF